MSDGGIYNIANNTDADANDIEAEFYQMLGLTNPTDEELEQAIIKKINETLYRYFFQSKNDYSS